MALGIMGSSLGLPSPKLQHWLGRIQCLELSFFVNTQHHGVVRRAQVEPVHINHLLSAQLQRLAAARQVAQALRARLQIALWPLNTVGVVICNCPQMAMDVPPSLSKSNICSPLRKALRRRIHSQPTLKRNNVGGLQCEGRDRTRHAGTISGRGAHNPGEV